MLLSIYAENSPPEREQFVWLHLPFISLNYSLFLLLLRKIGALNSSPQPSTQQSSLNGWRASRGTTCPHYPGSRYPGESCMRSPSPANCWKGWSLPKDSLDGGAAVQPPILSAVHPAELFAVAGKGQTSQVENLLGSSLFNSLWNCFN